MKIRHSMMCLMVVMSWACGDDDDTSGTTNLTTGTATTGEDTSGSPSTTAETNTNGTTDSTTVSTTNTTNTDSGPQDTGPAEESSDGGPADTGPADTGPAESGDSSGGGPLDNCLMMAADDCEACACNNCLAELMACQADPGCIAIRMCAQENGCTGIECLGPCGDVINMNGGPLGPSAGLASALSDCYTGACPDC